MASENIINAKPITAHLESGNMGLMFWYMLVLLLIMVWTVALTFIMTKWKDRLEKGSFSVMGPFLMWKTRRGREFIEGVAERRPRLVEWYGRIAVGITGASMATMTALLCFTAYLVVERARDLDLDPHMLLGLPGLNPLIPLWYGIIGLVVAMVVHEFSHGIITALAKVKILSLGILLFIVPMGAFVEPDEEGIKNLEKKKRVRMYSAGPASNIIVAGIFSLLFSVVLMSSVSIAHSGVGITSAPEPIEIGGTEIATPAMNLGLAEGMIIFSFDGVDITNRSDFNLALNRTTPGQAVTIGYWHSDAEHYADVTLANKSLYYWDYYEGKWGENYTAGFLDSMDWDYTQENVTKAQDWYFNKGYLGVTSMTVTERQFHPIGDSGSLSDLGESIALYMTLPLQGLSPVDGATADFYVIDGFWSFLPDSLFWIISNVCYWIFWLNLMVGLSNALPAVPLDGGYIFKDWLDSLLAKSGFREETIRKKAVDRIGFVVALGILFLILWQVIGPRIL